MIDTPGTQPSQLRQQLGRRIVKITTPVKAAPEQRARTSPKPPAKSCSVQIK